MTSLRVLSETGWLRRVLVCSPGDEWRRVPPSERERYLVEDLLEPGRAVDQHREFVRVLSTLMQAAPPGLDPQVVDVRTELRAGLADPQVRGLSQELFDQICEAERDAWPQGGRFDREGVQKALLRLFDAGAWDDLVDAVLSGLPDDKPHPEDPLFLLGPAPNALFARDYQVVVGSGAAISAMAKEARRREPALARFLFAARPVLRSAGLPFDGTDLVRRCREEARCGDEVGASVPRDGPGTLAGDLARIAERTRATGGMPWLEGGDVMVLSSEAIAVGIGERTSWRGVEALALGLRRLREDDPDAFPFVRLLAVELPRKRAMMHLDTVFTLVDEGLALAFPPLTFPGAREEMNVVQCALNASFADPIRWEWRGRFSEAMAAEWRSRGLPLALIAGGGKHKSAQLREQWCDGCNAVAVGPGVILGYERNRTTSSILANLPDHARVSGLVAVLEPGGDDLLRAFRVVKSHEVDTTSARAWLGGGERVFACIDGSELGRARGGPHCMTMALVRD